MSITSTLSYKTELNLTFNWLASWAKILNLKNFIEIVFFQECQERGWTVEMEFFYTLTFLFTSRNGWRWMVDYNYVSAVFRMLLIRIFQPEVQIIRWTLWNPLTPDLVNWYVCAKRNLILNSTSVDKFVFIVFNPLLRTVQRGCKQIRFIYFRLLRRKILQ